jgi:hypothetical protein
MAAINCWLESQITHFPKYTNPLSLTETQWKRIKERIRPVFEKTFVGLGSIYERLYNDCRHHLLLQALGRVSEKPVLNDLSKTIFRYPKDILSKKICVKLPLRCREVLIERFKAQVRSVPAMTAHELLDLMRKNARDLYPAFSCDDGEIEELVWSALQDLQLAATRQSL